MIDSERHQCTSHKDCAGAGRDQQNWVCVNHLCQRLEPDAGAEYPEGFACLKDLPPLLSGKTEWRLSFIDWVAKQALTEGVANVCYAYDVTCQNPVAENLQPDSEGIVSFTVNGDFTGYVEFQHLDLLPTLAWINPNQLRSEVGYEDSYPIPVFSETIFRSMGQLVGRTVDPAAGQVLGLAADCNLNPAEGVSATLKTMNGEAEDFFYISGSDFPVEASATQSSGKWGGFNVPPGTGEAVVRFPDTQQLIGRSALIVRSGHLTVLTVAPSPPYEGP